MNPHYGLAVVLLPFSVVLAVRTLPRQWRALRRSGQAAERWHWRLSFSGYAIVSVGLFGASLWLLDQLLGAPLRMSAWWFSPARMLGWAARAHDAALVDMLLALGVGLAAILASGWFGYVDENGEWCRSKWPGEEAEDADARRRDEEGR